MIELLQDHEFPFWRVKFPDGIECYLCPYCHEQVFDDTSSGFTLDRSCEVVTCEHCRLEGNVLTIEDMLKAIGDCEIQFADCEWCIWFDTAEGIDNAQNESLSQAIWLAYQQWRQEQDNV